MTAKENKFKERKYPVSPNTDRQFVRSNGLLIKHALTEEDALLINSNGPSGPLLFVLYLRFWPEKG